VSITGSWSPDQGQQDNKPSIPAQRLEALLQLCIEQPLESLPKLDGTLIESEAELMQMHKDSWLASARPLSDAQIVQLIRFFTLAEETLPGWEAGSRSPVIWLCRELKHRGQFPDSKLIEWIRGHSSNKFLPYGNILDL